MERETGIEPATTGLGSRCSTIELLPLVCSQNNITAPRPLPLGINGTPARRSERNGDRLRREFQRHPTTEPVSLTLSPVLGDGLFKLLPGKQLQHLDEDAGYSYHAVIALPIQITSRNANRSRALPPLLKTYFGQQCFLFLFTIDGQRKMP